MTDAITKINLKDGAPPTKLTKAGSLHAPLATPEDIGPDYVSVSISCFFIIHTICKIFRIFCTIVFIFFILKAQLTNRIQAITPGMLFLLV